MVVYLLGTSHISAKSVAQIKKEISSLKYGVVAVELDVMRLQSLFSKVKSSISPMMIFQVGVFGYLFAVVGRIVQQHLGRVVGVMPGEEMKTAVLLSKKHDLKIALIDRRIDRTLKAFSKEFSFKDKARMVYDMFRGMFFQKKYLKEVGFSSFDLRSVPSSEVVEKMIGYIGRRYPSLHKVLISDRNKVMVRALEKVAEKHPEAEVLAVVGAGHVPGMKKLFEKKEVAFEIL
ncbi:hypothetical protein HOC01_05400 [archaeon]|jgi:pheromone shutdown protein TraB|nr:hypothetical protein [archaeon]MBT6697724.1 hypothetical protein [archaeon]